MAKRTNLFFLWTTLFIVSVCLATIVVFSGFNHSMGKFRSMLVSLLIVLLGHFLFGDPTRFLILASLDAFWSPENLKYATVAEVGHQKQLDYLNLRLNSLRAHLSIPEKHRNEKLNSQYREIVNDLWLFGKYFLFIMCLLLFLSDETTYYTRNHIKRLFTHNYSNYYGLNDVAELTGAYDFIKSSLIDGFAIKRDEFQNSWIHSEQTALLGVVRLRQLRVIDMEHDRVSDPPFSEKSYLPGWKLPYRRFPYDEVYWRIYEPWVFKNLNLKLNLLVVQQHTGYLRSYPKLSGYMSLLARSQQNSHVIVRFLRKNKWLTYNTSVLFMEFALYSVDAKLLTVCTLHIEHTSFGTMISHVNVNAISSFEKVDHLTHLTILFLILYIITFVDFVKGLAIKLWFEPAQIRSFWNKVDVAIFVLNILILIMTFIRESKVTNIFDHLANDSKMEFIQVLEATHVHSFTAILIGFLLCLITLRLWKALEFSNVFQIFTQTLYLSWRAVASVAVVIIVLLLGFAIAVSTFNGNNSFNFSQFRQSIITCTCFTFGYTNGVSPEELFHGGQFIGAIFFSILVFVISVILVNMFVSIINDFVCTAKHQRDMISGRRINIFQFIYAEMRVYVLKIKQLPKFRTRYRRNNRTVSENIMRSLQSIRNKRKKWEVTIAKAFVAKNTISPLDNIVEHAESKYNQERIYTIGAILNTQIDILQNLSNHHKRTRRQSE
ncbi:polycystin-2-like [Drosophila mojavensis]|uniref:polycystin-2-like n=1 Tax=Drosophila mojavensis TaxID=7230 RepID=UPI00017C7B4F|nr:polycystin-2-like [Drosophila mojavensis]XP_043863577.1 polycystin-2-like [Drosophila mojavensis]